MVVAVGDGLWCARDGKTRWDSRQTTVPAFRTWTWCWEERRFWPYGSNGVGSGPAAPKSPLCRVAARAANENRTSSRFYGSKGASSGFILEGSRAVGSSDARASHAVVEEHVP